MSELHPVFAAARARGVETRVTVGVEVVSTKTDIAAWSEAGSLSYVLDGELLAAPPGGAPFLRRAVLKAERTLRRLLPGGDVGSIARSLRRARRLARRILDETTPSALIIGEFTCEPLESSLAEIALQRGIPVVTVPIVQGGWEADLFARTRVLIGLSSSLDASRPLNGLIARRHPKLVHEFAGVRMLRFPAKESLARAWVGMVPRAPWLIAGGLPVMRAVGSDAEAAVIRREWPEGRVVVTGRPSMDRMARQLRDRDGRARMCAALDLDPTRPIVVVNGIYTVKPQIVPGESESFFDTLVTTIRTKPARQVVFSVHPGLDLAAYERIAARHGACVAHGWSIHELLAHADAYVTLSSSTTVIFAIACKVPTVGIEYWPHPHWAYHETEGLVRARTPDQLPQAMERVLDRPEERRQIVEALTRDAKTWGSHVDGQSSTRLLDLALGGSA